MPEVQILEFPARAHHEDINLEKAGHTTIFEKMSANHNIGINCNSSSVQQAM